MILFIGFRHDVGGDWNNYVELITRVAVEQPSWILSQKDPGYVLVNWASTRIGWGIYGVNMISCVIFLAGLTHFCWKQPLPSLAWLIATPYLIIVVGMGYTRQSVALGLILFAFSLLEKGKVWRFSFLLLLAMTFHRASVVLAPLVLSCVDGIVLKRIVGRLNLNKNYWPSIVVGVLIVGLAVLAVTLAVRVFHTEIKAYIYGNQWHSGGALVRVMMNAASAILLLCTRNYWTKRFGRSRIWYWLACVAVASVVSVLYFSTFTDRLSLYLLPLQIYVVSRIPMLFDDAVLRGGSIVGISGLYALVLFVWLNFADHIAYWVPYYNLVLP